MVLALDLVQLDLSVLGLVHGLRRAPLMDLVTPMALLVAATLGGEPPGSDVPAVGLRAGKRGYRRVGQAD